MNEDFNKGVENGLENLDKTNYEEYVSSQVSINWLSDSKQQTDTEIATLKEKIENTTAQKIALLEANQQIKHQYDNLQHDISVLEKQIENQEAKIENTKEEKVKNPLHYPLLAGIIYLAAGIIFLLGDLIISHEIVAYALNIKNNMEAWAFAAGLAGVTLLLKPAYERLVEEPYLKNPTEKSKKIHSYFQTTLVIIAISTLAILGWFRYEAYRVDKLKASINTEIKTLQLSSTPLIQGTETVENPEVTRQVEAKMKELDTLNKSLVNSTWALLSFVLSGVLFAIAGAICFGIAFPVLSSYWKRWFWHNPTINRSNRKINKLQKKLAEAKRPWNENASLLQLHSEKITLLPNREEQIEELRILEEKSDYLSKEIKRAMESSRVSIYNDGYENGLNSKSTLTEEEFKTYKNSLLDNIKNIRENAPDKSPKVYKTNGLRPHQALRKAITDTFNEN